MSLRTIQNEILNSLIEKRFFTSLLHRIKRTFLANIIKAIQRSKTPDNDENLLKVKVCIYIDALLSYFKQVNQVRLNAIVKLQPISTVTSKLDMYIRKKFSQPNVNKL